MEDTPMSNYKFETLQLHVGQEIAAAPDASASAATPPSKAATLFSRTSCVELVKRP